ncbi:hypothetical protein [Amycolatopsis sp. CA-126428]|uniref:hypothetical protein n=1 Tax=Amycolatopsis sp. CA-126428 TaxID=2073158 RepID=UPI0011B0B3B5|nr:hypothetical protein [Amycolatopsis sp. CA-126428]
MAEVSDFVVVDRNKLEPSVGGKWKSPTFATGARNILTSGGTERNNAYITLTFSVQSDVPNGFSAIRIIVNDHPLSQLVQGKEDSYNTIVSALFASFLKDGGGNVVELHAQNENSFIVRHVVVHFRQNT